MRGLGSRQRMGSLLGMSAVGAEAVLWIEDPTASLADLFSRRWSGLRIDAAPRPGQRGLATRAPAEGCTFFHPHQGDEKEAEIVIQPTLVDLGQSALGTNLIGFGPPVGTGLNAGDEKHGGFGFPV